MAILECMVYMAAINKIDRECLAAMTGHKNVRLPYYELSRELCEHPEIIFQEKFAHDTLCNFLESNQFRVERNYLYPTAFKAEYEAKAGCKTVVAIFCQYDAQPDIGHACGHNLVTEAAVAAGIGIKDALETNIFLKGKVIIFGTPGETANVKAELIKSGALNNVDIAITVHPSSSDSLDFPFLGTMQGRARFEGKAAYASDLGHRGINALDAAVEAYNAITELKRNLKPTSHINAVITEGGKTPTIIPKSSQLEFFIQAEKSNELENLGQILKKQMAVAAEMHSCLLNVEMEVTGMQVLTNKKLAKIYKNHAESFNISFDSEMCNVPLIPSTDFARVSHLVPSIHANFCIGKDVPNQPSQFAEMARSFGAQRPTLIAAKCLALTALDVMTYPNLLTDIRKQFKMDKEDSVLSASSSSSSIYSQ